jgi:hypothetical protein
LLVSLVLLVYAWVFLTNLTNSTNRTNQTAFVKDVKFSFSKKKYVGIDMDIYKKIRKEAQKQNKPEDVLIGEWLKNKMSLVKG